MKNYLVFFIYFLVFLFLSQLTMAKNQKSRQQKSRFDHLGVQVGDKIPDVTVYTADKKAVTLSQIIQNKPIMLVSVSLTCPVARRKMPQLMNIITTFKDSISFYILYILEAHPAGSNSPYANREWVTDRNHKEGLIRKQPKTLSDRLALAQEFKELMDIRIPMFVDGIDNQAWEMLGQAPNFGLFIQPDGQVVAKHGWFDPTTMRNSIQTYLAKFQ